MIKSLYQKWFEHIAPVSSPFPLYFPRAINLKFAENDTRVLESVTILEKNPRTHHERKVTYETKIANRWGRDNHMQGPGPCNIPYPLKDLSINLMTDKYKDHPPIKVEQILQPAGPMSPLVSYSSSDSYQSSDGPIYQESENAPDENSPLETLGTKRKRT